jgi:octaheme c-type cytochrome (tetrathionate reductase family)
MLLALLGSKKPVASGNACRWPTSVSDLHLTRLISLLLISSISFTCSLATAGENASFKTIDNGENKNPSRSTADHRKFDQLQGPFEIEEISKACLDCHNEASVQLHATTHWTWEVSNGSSGQILGKKHVANNFLISLPSNYEGCTSCHISFDWVDDRFDFTSQEQVDCMICHDTTGTYAMEKFHQDGAKCYVCHDEKLKDSELEPVDLAEVAQQVGPTNRKACGSCHFYGGAADGAKHGDLDSSLGLPDRAIDVHMDSEGLNFTCATCHRTGQHVVMGSRYEQRPSDEEGIDVMHGGHGTCPSCHGLEPMKDPKLNEHTDKVACQTCHIPTFAKGGVATKMAWDWSTAGKRARRGKPITRKDDNDRVIYSSQKGDTTWDENVVPSYIWFNGNVSYTLPADKIDPVNTVPINIYSGSPSDAASRIFPVKIASGMQPYDTTNMTLALPRLVGRKKDAYWTGYDWDKALKSGMKMAGLPFSGNYDFVRTEMLWPINHMVAPAEESLACIDCHSRNGRMADIQGVYIPGRDLNPLVEIAGLGLLGAALFGVFIHSFLRIVFHIMRNKASKTSRRSRP